MASSVQYVMEMESKSIGFKELKANYNDEKT